MRNIAIALVVLLSFCSTYTFSQSPFFRKHVLPLEYKNAGINCILQDKNRFIWFGTTVGLVRFDGFTHKHFFEPSQSENEVTTLFEDAGGILWVGYKNGRIGRFSNENFLNSDSSKFSVNVPITGIAQTSDSAIWVSTYGQGILVFDGQTRTSYDSSRGLPDNYIYSMDAGNNGEVYAGSDHGLFVIRKSEKSIDLDVISEDRGLVDNILPAVAFYRNQVWLGSESQGLARYDVEKRRVDYPFPEWPYGRITSIFPFEKAIWVGTASQGIVEIDIDGKYYNHFNQDDRKLPMRITSFCADSESNVWIASGSPSVYSGNKLFSFMSRLSQENFGNIQAILYRKDGDLLFSTSAGVFTMNHHEAQNAMPGPLHVKQLEGTQVISLYEDAQGGVWFGTFDKGVFHLEPKTNRVSQFTEKDGLVNNNVLSIGGTANEVWFATLGGVSQGIVNGDKIAFTNYTSENGLGSNYIYKVFIDSHKRVWFATDGKGISVRENGSFKNYSLSEGLNSNIVYSVSEDSKGAIWLSTSNAGIFRFNERNFLAFTPHNGIRDLNISSIIGDMNGNLLLVSRQGIDVLDAKSGTIFYHGQESGIMDIDPNLNAYSKDPDGNIWMATQNGIVKYNAELGPLQKWPTTRINEMQIFLSKADTTDRTITYNQNHISFDYLGFWYHDPEEVSYKIKLEGYDREWIYSKNHFITYPNLPPGNYTFMVQSSVTNYFEGAAVKKFSFVIAPPFYSTPWFYALCLIVGLSVIYAIIKLREQRLKENQRIEREKIEFQFETLKNQVNPHFLFNSFNTLIGVIEEDRDTAVEYVIKLSDFYRDILVNRERESIPLSKEIELIRNYYFLQTKRYKDNFRMSIDVPSGAMALEIPPLTLQLLVENAIKHNIISRDKPLQVMIYQETDHLVVKNNLQRKVIHESSTGIGLTNISNRLRLLTAKPLRIEETSEYFAVYIPLLNPRA